MSKVNAATIAGKDWRMTKTTDKVADAAGNVKPYVARAIQDEDVRDNVKAAFQAAREVYDELIGNRSVSTVATRVATDREIQDKLREAVEEGKPGPASNGAKSAANSFARAAES